MLEAGGVVADGVLVDGPDLHAAGDEVLGQRLAGLELLGGHRPAGMEADRLAAGPGRHLAQLGPDRFDAEEPLGLVRGLGRVQFGVLRQQRARRGLALGEGAVALGDLRLLVREQRIERGLRVHRPQPPVGPPGRREEGETGQLLQVRAYVVLGPREFRGDIGDGDIRPSEDEAVERI